jgi:integrase
MTQIKPQNADCAFVANGTPFFSDLIQQLAKDTDLSHSRRRDMQSGVRRVAHALGRPLSEVPCDSRWLQPRLAKVAPAAVNLTPKSWQNITSNARAAMAQFGLVERRNNNIDDLSPEWHALWRSILESGDKSIPPALCRFVHFLNTLGVGPTQVTDGHATAYLEAVTQNEISKSPQTAYRAAVNGWNLAHKRIPGWPDHLLSLPSRQKVIRIALTDFTKSFQEDVEELLQQLSDSDPLAPSNWAKALSPSTVHQYNVLIVRFASELHHSGMPLSEITSIDVLLHNAERGLRHMLNATGNVTNKQIFNIASLLRNLGRKREVGEDQMAELTRLAQALAPRVQIGMSPKVQFGMTPKNRMRLRILQQPNNQQRLLALPEHLLARIPPNSLTHKNALIQEDALAISILLYCPIRIKNLAQLTLDRHIQRPQEWRCYLVLSEEDTKSGRPIEFELPPPVVKLLDRHLGNRSPVLCPVLCPAGTSFLFPRRDGSAPITPSQLSSRLTKRVRKETGFEFNAHLFRHFAVMIWLDANPGAYEVARRLLGHSETSHTINMYSGLEHRSAARAFADLIDGKTGKAIR